MDKQFSEGDAISWVEPHEHLGANYGLYHIGKVSSVGKTCLLVEVTYVIPFSEFEY